MPYKIGPNAVKKSSLIILSHAPIWDLDYETIERKGFGHPDTIVDNLAARVSQSYSRYTKINCDGFVLHHQIDKLMVIGGKSKVTFGKGQFVEPIRVIVAGRASYTYGKKSIPINKIIGETIRSFFKEYFPLIKKENIIIENYLTNYAGPGTITESTGAIANMFNPKSNIEVRGYEKLVANDTSYCVAYAPLSPLELSIIEVEKYLNDKKTKVKYPWLGSDIKIMAVRDKKNVSITTCIPQIAKYVPSFEDYLKNLNLIGSIIDRKFSKLLHFYNVDISINTKDDYEKMNIYLTISGSSLSGDIGVVGRGNRTNGLITSNRPMSLEGTNGKNPRYYSGFIYAILSKKISTQIYQQTKKPVIVEIVSQNGGLLKNPWRIRIITEASRNTVKEIVERELINIEEITEEFVRGKIENF